MTTILVTDLVGSTRLTRSLGTERYQQLQRRYEAQADQICTARGGAMHEEVDPGDGIIALFDSTAEAVLAAQELMTAAEATGLQTRAGIHVGERPVSRVAIADADRICRRAAGGETALSAAVLEALPPLVGRATASTGIDLTTGSTSIYLLRGFVPPEALR